LKKGLRKMEDYPEQKIAPINMKALNDNQPATLVDEAHSWGEPQAAPEIAVLEMNYHQIAELYDMAENLLSTAEDERILDNEAQLDLVEPLVAQLTESTDVLCEEFIEVAGKKKRNANSRGKIEGALRRIYLAIDNYNEQLGKMANGAAEGIRNIADPVVAKIKNHVEFVITIFVDYIDMSLDRIMTKLHLAELKKRQEKISHMLYMAERQSRFERS
jgi:hypothetical protein